MASTGSIDLQKQKGPYPCFSMQDAGQRFQRIHPYGLDSRYTNKSVRFEGFTDRGWLFFSNGEFIRPNYFSLPPSWNDGNWVRVTDLFNEALRKK